jgi:hypothetical protein
MSRIFALTIGLIIVALIIGEGVLRGIGIPHTLNSGWGWTDSPGRKSSKYNDLAANQLGYRGQRIHYGTDDYVVVLVGDRGLEASAGPLEHMPEQLLQKS